MPARHGQFRILGGQRALRPCRRRQRASFWSGIRAGTPTPMLRTTFKTSGKAVEGARLYVTARGIYEIFLNGKRVGDDYYNPGLTQYNMTHMYQTYDVTGMIKAGENAWARCSGRAGGAACSASATSGITSATGSRCWPNSSSRTRMALRTRSPPTARRGNTTATGLWCTAAWILARFTMPPGSPLWRAGRPLPMTTANGRARPSCRWRVRRFRGRNRRAGEGRGRRSITTSYR